MYEDETALTYSLIITGGFGYDDFRPSVLSPQGPNVYQARAETWSLDITPGTSAIRFWSDSDYTAAELVGPGARAASMGVFRYGVGIINSGGSICNSSVASQRVGTSAACLVPPSPGS